MKNLLAVAVVVAVASIALSQDPNVPPEFRDRPAPPVGASPSAVEHQQKWEYTVTDREGVVASEWSKKLNEMAKEGWELDALEKGVFIFRRSVQQARARTGDPKLKDAADLLRSNRAKG